MLFAGGLIGSIREVREHTFLIEIGQGVTVEVARGAVSKLLQEGDKPTVEEARA